MTASATAPGTVAELSDGRLSADELELLAGVDGFLAKGLELQAWWRERLATGTFEHRFQLGRTFNEPGAGFGFFDTATVGGRPLPVMGNFQEMFYDRPKPRPDDRRPSAEWMRDQVRAFVLRYFMRVSDYRDPQGFAESWRPPTSRALQTLSWCPRDGDPTRRGFGFQQLYFKLRGGGVGRFPDEERFAIVDLRELGRRFEWIVVKVCIFDFNLTFRPLGSGGPAIQLPLQEDSLLVLASDFVADEERPEPGVLGRFGLGYAFLRNPQPQLFAYGPGEFDAAFEKIDFRVVDGGEVRVSAAFVANQPERVINLEIDPLGWGLAAANLLSLGLARPLLAPAEQARRRADWPRFDFDPVLSYIGFANSVSGGLAAEELCISREQLYKEFLLQHFMQHYETLSGSLFVWRLIADWLDDAALPAWVRNGKAT